MLIGLLGASQGQMSTEQLAQALLETTGEHPKLGHRYESKLAFQVRNASGTVIARSFNVPQLTDADWQPGFADLQQDNRQWRGYVLDSDESGWRSGWASAAMCAASWSTRSCAARWCQTCWVFH
ncbi:sensor histidine kinase N-terminal domain-containing protein [Halopseudomonas pachastrellae]|nr:sensor histidine kinase N-terminal domain-containing protein [Halopseudomonas pachastrellae]